MKIYFIFLATFFLGVLNCNAQAIRYDTVPDPRTKQQPEPSLYKVEQPEQQQAKQAKPQQQETSHQSSSSHTGRIVIGGAFGMSFGSNYTSINISPQVGYEFNRFLTAGGGISYFYYKNDLNIINSNDFSQNYLGLNLYGRLSPIRFISLQVQPELYQMWGSSGGKSLDSQTVPCFLVGGGVNIPAGKGAISTMVYYDLVQDDWSPYGDQLFYSIGYIFSF